MQNILSFDIKTYRRSYTSYAILLLLVLLGVFTGSKFNMSPGQDIRLDGSYTIGFMTGFLSLAIIFIATVLSGQLLFKEWDNRFDTILFTTPVKKQAYLKERFMAFFLLTFTCFCCMILGFAIGQYMRSGSHFEPVTFMYYLYPLVLFGVINTLFTCTLLYSIALLSRRKMLVITGGLLLYILYMVVLLFSNAPFMAGSTPQSLSAQQLSALSDPFSLSAYFYTAKDFTVSQRNTQLVWPVGYLLINRLLFIVLSVILLWVTHRFFSFGSRKAGKKKTHETVIRLPSFTATVLPRINPATGAMARVNALFSFMKKDLTYLFKSISFVVVTLLLLFFVGMELYAEIEKGIRLPQLYARSGLMATTIIENFHFLGLLLIVYFANDVYWRSKASGFSVIEQTTLFSNTKLTSHWLSCSILLICFTSLLVVLALIFQWAYDYTQINWSAYRGVFVFTTLPLVLFTGAVLVINHVIRNKYVALTVSLLLAFLSIGTIAQKLLPYPLLRFFSTLPVSYSDFNGYSIYLSSFLYRLLFGAALVLLLIKLVNSSRRSLLQPSLSWLLILPVITAGAFAARQYNTGYHKIPAQEQVEQAVQYEKQYRSFQSLPQPVITSVITTIELYPDQQSYTIKGRYTLKNETDKPVEQVLMNFHPDLSILKATYIQGQQQTMLREKVSVIPLSQPLLNGDTAVLDFTLSYKWYAVNGHSPMNAMMENGSFMRISRYYPQPGYQADYELSDEATRKQYALGKATGELALDDPRTSHHFIQLDMTIGTSATQTPIGTGEPVNRWQDNQRQYARYRPVQPVPFRFAISSANYALSTGQFEQVPIYIYYHPAHHQNVAPLMNNIKATLAYCQQNFGPYPFRTLSFAEVSAYTKGFAATAYPGVIFMTENVVFQANIQTDRKQDVINELAGHEIAHFWWGNQAIAPDNREGAAMLTETLAMYTEMMVYKKVHGAEKMKERLQVHRQIYDAEKGFSGPQPLYKVAAGNAPLSYSKGALVMVELSELIGEDKVNAALRNFLQAHQYPQPVPVSTDLIEEFLKISEIQYHNRIRDLFQKP